MGAGKKNPFEQFGLTPELVADLSEKDLFVVIKSLYRALLKVYHPDYNYARRTKAAAKRAARAVELNLAFEQLNMDRDRDAFRRHRRAYSGRTRQGLKRKIDELSEELARGVDEKDALADGYMDYLLSGLPWNTDNGQEPSQPILAPANVKLGLNDVAITQNIRTASWSLGSNYKEIVFDPLGAMFYRPVGRSRPFPVNYIYLLGTIKTDQIDLIPLLDRVPPRDGFFKHPVLDSRYGIDGTPLKVLNTIPVDRFKSHCLHLLRPELTERTFLFSIHRPVYDQERSISLEGVIVKKSKP
jgi:hypothetical protein